MASRSLQVDLWRGSVSSPLRVPLRDWLVSLCCWAESGPLPRRRATSDSRGGRSDASELFSAGQEVNVSHKTKHQLFWSSISEVSDSKLNISGLWTKLDVLITVLVYKNVAQWLLAGCKGCRCVGFAHQQVQIRHVCLDVVPVVRFNFGEVLKLRFGFGSQRVHEGSHPPDTRGDALPRQAWNTNGSELWVKAVWHFIEEGTLKV